MSQGDILKKFIRHQRISQRELARELGITESFLSHVLSGRRQLGVRAALIASKIIGIRLEEFFR